MAIKAVDVVLLPSEQMADKAIEANRELLKQCPNKITLDKKNCLPHISLNMGCIDEADIADIEKILESIAKQSSLKELNVTGLRTETNSAGEKVTVLQIESTRALQSLHEQIILKLTPYITNYDVNADMLFSSSEASKSTLLWIKNYPDKSSFESFSPHITLGYGQINNFSFPTKFPVSKLALCHLGNHCTCKEILASAKL
jgi:2'-5' RNA ligase